MPICITRVVRRMKHLPYTSWLLTQKFKPIWFGPALLQRKNLQLHGRCPTSLRITDKDIMAEQSEMVGKHSSYYWQDNPSQIYHHITFWFHTEVQEFLSHVLKSSECNHDHKVLLPREGCNWSDGALPPSFRLTSATAFLKTTSAGAGIWVGVLKSFKIFQRTN